MTIWNSLLEKSEHLDAFAMMVRALMVFIATLLFLRIAGRRAFGQKTAFDLCVTVLLGAILSRAVVGASEMMPTLAAGATLVLSHRLLAVISIRWPAIDRLVNGDERSLVRDGVRDENEMRAGLISDHDLDEALRKKTGRADRSRILDATLERNGEISLGIRGADGRQ